MRANTPDDYRTVDAAAMDSSETRVVMGACIGPRPVALVTTIGPGGVVNAAPFSNFMGVSTEPLLVAIALGRRDGEEKDTLKNVRETGAFTINAVSVDMAEAAHHTAADYPRHKSEVDPAGLHTLPGVATNVPRIAEAPIHLECRLFRLVEIGEPEPGNVIILGEVIGIHVRADLVKPDGLVDGIAWQPLGGVGDDYMRPGETFSLPYPTPSE